MEDLAVLTPSFGGDASLFADLHASVLANTGRSVVHHVVVPPSDVHLFREYAGPRCRVWTHRDLLPRRFLPIPHASGLALNLRRPWPPVRGWIVQQLMKMAGTAAIDARAVLLADSDSALVRFAAPPTSSRTTAGSGITARSAPSRPAWSRHILWHNVARSLRLPGVAVPPLPEYVSPIPCGTPSWFVR